MNELRNDSSRLADESSGSTERSEDFRALRTTTADEMPTLDEVVRAARRRPLPHWEERMKSTTQSLKARPWLTTAIAGAVAALALLVIPVSYERTTGREVSLSVSGPNLGMDGVRGIAQEYKRALGVDHVTVEATNADGRENFVLKATVPATSKVNSAAAARIFAGGLSKLGYQAAATTRLLKEKVSGPVYAYALDRVIQISMDGKSASQLESEIRQRLIDAGVTGANVSVTDSGDHGRTIKVTADHHIDGSNPEHAPIPELVLTKNGAPIEGQGFMVRVEKRRTGDGTTLTLRVNKDGKSTVVDIANVETKSDAAIASEVEAQLKQAGIDAKVTVTNGQVAIEPNQNH